ncbi:uncharacterized protein LY89DRAFT_136365 [Mollisia scopiformis]|uniref:Lyr family protein n=1 Tax=Mollisia scopiformis TaxID=149040 RepID=A0A194X2V1_MOLSC|nr:uncharacterized protein LY89DRAFT_136365 [Mollisia scopiformis]KUJ14349.1 hypothetical protein LY89DRAFT_136365 [Mollisia scopiformis]
MAPTYRNQNRRQNRTGVIDHDIYEGIPVRQWRREYVTVAPPPTQDSTTSQNDIWAVELPHGMPKDSHLLPQHSQDLLRAARSGRIYKRPAPPEEEEADPEAILGDKPEKKEEDPKDKGFTAKAWKPAPRHLDLTDNDYLAKKRKNLVPKKPNPPPVIATVTKTTVKRIDAAGNEYVQDVVVPHGQKVEGEVIAQTVIPDPSAIADPFTAQPTPPKRKGGTSKKKLKGPGRGRKKKQQQLAPTSAPQPAPVDGVVQSTPVEGVVGAEGMKIEADANGTPTNNEDTEMGEGSMAASDDDDGDDGDDGEDGDDGDDDEGSDAQNSPSKRPRTTSPPPGSLPPISSIPDLAQPDTIMGGTELAGPAKIFTDREKSEGKSGSPLKTVALTASALTSPHESPTFAGPAGTFPEPAHQSPVTASTEVSDLNEVMQQEVVESAPTILPPPPPEPTEAEVEAAVEMRQEEEEEEEMLLDIQDNANNAQIGGPEPVAPEPIVSEPVISEPEREVIVEKLLVEVVPVEVIPTEIIPPAVAPTEAVPIETIPAEVVETVEIPSVVQTVIEPPVLQPVEVTEIGEVVEERKAEEPAPELAPVSAPVPESIPAPEADDDDDNYPDLLGGLERSLEKKEAKQEKVETEDGKEAEPAPAVES